MDFFSAFGHNEAQGHYQTIYHTQEIHPHHKASFTHEAIAGAVGFAAMHAYESHLRATGQQPSHPLMKEILAGIAAAEVDKLVETKGMDWIDRHKAKKMAAHQAHELAAQRYQGGTGWEYAQARGGHSMAYDYEGGHPWGAPGHSWYESYTSGGYPQESYYPPPQGYPPAGYSQQTYYEQGYPVQPGYGGYEGGYQEEHHRHHHHHHEY